MTNIDRCVADFAHSLNRGRLIRPAMIPDPTAEFGWCFKNVGQKIARDGGLCQTGWQIVNEGGFLMAVHHGVWVSPDGDFIDVTPLPKEVKAKMLGFVCDNTATVARPSGCQWGCARGNRFWVMSSKAASIVSRLAAKERQYDAIYQQLAC